MHIFTHQDFHNCDALINLYNLQQWCIITTENYRHLIFSDGPFEECVDTAEVGEMVEEVVDLTNLEILVKDEVGLVM